MFAGVADTHTALWYLLADPRLSAKPSPRGEWLFAPEFWTGDARMDAELKQHLEEMEHRIMQGMGGTLDAVEVRITEAIANGHELETKIVGERNVSTLLRHLEA